MEIKNLKKAAQRIFKAVKNKERILLYGDADLDGVVSIILLKEALEQLGAFEIKVYFPDREKEGYGINEKALNYIKKYAPALLISLDCGIGNFEEVKLAKSLGFEVMIIDHHEILNNKLPGVSIIVDPKQKEDKYPFKNFAAAGIVFELSRVLLATSFSKTLRKSFLELVSLATIADKMPEISENERFIQEGLNSLEKTSRPGLKVFFRKNFIEKYKSVRNTAQKVASILNAITIERKNHSNKTYLLLTSNSVQEANILAKDLLRQNRRQREKIQEITGKIKKRVVKKINEKIVFEGDKSLPLILAGSVASNICNEFYKPTFIFKINKAESRGAVRMPKGLNGVRAMESCAYLLEVYGGHAPAAGFTIKNKNLEKFKQCLIVYFNKQR